ncbi:MAG: hypothetical protein RLZZ28_1502 [Bacteroidota bacterium]|jgi:uncharacterized membrane protein YfcA
MTLATFVLLLLIGLAAGFLSGLVGIGGGIVIVPALVLFLGFSQKLAQGTSLGILLLPVGILAVIQYYKQGYLNVNYVVIVATAFVLGSFLGSKLALSLSEDKMKRIFALIMMLIAIKMLFFDRSKASQVKDPGPSSTKIQQSGQ